MAFMIKQIIDLKGILLLMLLIIQSKATNLDCYSKAFHCVNSTHFMICVDLGRGISTTIDDVIIPCPSPTVCKRSNRFECEFPTLSEPEFSTVANTQMTESEVSTFIPIVTSSIPFEEYYNTLNTNALPANEGNLFTTESSLAAKPITTEINISGTETAMADSIPMELNVKPEPDSVNSVGSIIPSDANSSNEENVTQNLNIILNDMTSTKNIHQSTTIIDLQTEVITDSPVSNIENNKATSTNNVTEGKLSTETVITIDLQTDFPNATATVTVSDVTKPPLTTEELTTLFGSSFTEFSNYISNETNNPSIASEKIVANDFVQPSLNTTSTVLTSAVTEKIEVTTEKINNFGDSLIKTTVTDTTKAINNETVTTEETITNSFVQSSMNSTSTSISTPTSEPTLITEQTFKTDFQDPLINVKKNIFTISTNKETSVTQNITPDAFIPFSTIGPSTTDALSKQTVSTTDMTTRKVIENLNNILNVSDVTTVNPIQTAQPIISASNTVNYIDNESIATLNVESVTNTLLVNYDKSNTFTTPTFLFTSDDYNLNNETSADIITTKSTEVNDSSNPLSFNITTTMEPAISTNLVVDETILQTNKTTDTTASLTDSSVTTETQLNMYEIDRVLAYDLPALNIKSNNTNRINKTITTAAISETYEDFSSGNTAVETSAVTEPTPSITSENNLETVTTVDSVTTTKVSENTFSTDSPKVIENLELTMTMSPNSNTIPEVVKKLETFENASNTTTITTTENIVNTLQSDDEKIVSHLNGFSENFTDQFEKNETVTVVPSSYEIKKTSTKVFDVNSHNNTETDTINVSDSVQVNNFTNALEFEQIPALGVAKNYKEVLEETATSLRKTTEQTEPTSTLLTSQPLSSFTIYVTDKISTMDGMNQIKENANTIVYNETQAVATDMPPTTISSETESLSFLQGQIEIAISPKRIETITSNPRTVVVGENTKTFSTQSLSEISTPLPTTEIKIENFQASTDYVSQETTSSFPTTTQTQTTTQNLFLESIDDGYSTTEIPLVTNTVSVKTTKHMSTGFVVSSERQPETNSKSFDNNPETQDSVVTPSDFIKLHTSMSHTNIPPSTVLEIYNENLIATTESIKHSDILSDKLITSLHSKVTSTTDASVMGSTSNPSINNSPVEITNPVFTTTSYFANENNPLKNVVLNSTPQLEENIQETVASTIPGLYMKLLSTMDKKLGLHETAVNKTEREPNILTTMENGGTNNKYINLIPQTKVFLKTISENMLNETNQNLNNFSINSDKQPTVLSTPNYEGATNTLLENYDTEKNLNLNQEKIHLNTENTLSTFSNTTNKTDIPIAIINMPEETRVTRGISTPPSSVQPVTYATQTTQQSSTKLYDTKKSIYENPTTESQRVKFNENKLQQTTSDTSLTANKLLEHEGYTSSDASYLLEDTTVKSSVRGESSSLNPQKENIPNLIKPFVIDVTRPYDLVTEKDVTAKNLNSINVMSTLAKPTIQDVESRATAGVFSLITKAPVYRINTKQKPFESEDLNTDVTTTMNTERYPKVSSTPPPPPGLLKSGANKMETIGDANDTNQPDKRSVNMNYHVTVASTVTVNNLNSKMIKSTEKNEKIGSSSTILSTSSPDLDITTQQMITGSDVVVDKNMEREKTHSGIISFLKPPPKSLETMKEIEKSEDNEGNLKQKSEIPKLATPSAVHTTTSTLVIFNESLPKNINNNPQKEFTKREELVINTEKKDFITTDITNIEVLSSTKIKTDKIINNGMHTVIGGNKNQTPTYSSIENRASTNESHKSNSISKDQNNTSYHADNKTVISNDQSSTPRYKSQINITAPSNTQTTAFPALESSTQNTKSNDFSCKHKNRGRYADQKDCKKFYICVGNEHVVEGTCPNNTVFSDIRKQCTKNLSHCIRNNQFRCVTEGRFSDFLNDKFYYICVKNNNRLNSFIRFKLLCQNGYHLNKTSIRCVLNAESSSQQSTSKSDSSKNISDQSGSLTKQDEPEENTEKPIKKFKCKKEGIFPDPTNCRKYYECKKTDKSYRQKKKKCGSDEIFHKDKKKCVESDSCEYEC